MNRLAIRASAFALAVPVALGVTSGQAGPARPITLAAPAPAVAYVAASAGGVTNTATTYDSGGGTPGVAWNGTGNYTVTFPNLNGNGGDVQVTATGDPSATCRTNGWANGYLQITVLCSDLAGNAVDSAFTVLFTDHAGPMTGSVYDYAWNYLPNASGSLTGQYQYNSAGKTNSVLRVGLGQYVVSFPGPLATGPDTGTVAVTARTGSLYGNAPATCQVASMSATTSAATTTHKIGVDCFSSAGGPADGQFDIVYARGTGILGLAGLPAANAFASDASAAATLYRPAVQWDSHAGARVTVIHLDRGIYEVVAFGASPTHNPGGGNGDWQITGYGAAAVHCAGPFVSTHQPYAYIHCANASGAAANEPFLVQWAVAH